MSEIKNLVYNKIKENDDSLVLRSYVLFEHSEHLVYERDFTEIGVKMKVNSKNKGSLRHLAVFENQLKAPEEIRLSSNNFEEWLEQHEIVENNWKLVDVDNFMEGNTFFPQIHASLSKSVKDIVLDSERAVLDNEMSFTELLSEYSQNDYKHVENDTKALDQVEFTNRIDKLTFAYNLTPFLASDEKHSNKIIEQLLTLKNRLNLIESLENNNLPNTSKIQLNSLQVKF